jgi:hypothetical protein
VAQLSALGRFIHYEQTQNTQNGNDGAGCRLYRITIILRSCSSYLSQTDKIYAGADKLYAQPSGKVFARNKY